MMTLHPSMATAAAPYSALTPSLRFLHRLRPRAALQNPEPEPERRKTPKPAALALLSLSAALTASPALAATATKKPAAKRPRAKKPEALTAEELREWSRGLPAVSERLPYTELIHLKRAGSLKHVIKPPGAALRRRPEVVIVVSAGDARASRAVLPSAESDPGFWRDWDELGMDAACVNAYSPPVKAPEIPAPYLGFAWKAVELGYSLLKPRPVSKKALELRRQREEMRRARKAELEGMRREREAREKARKYQRREEERERKRELKRQQYEESAVIAHMNSHHMANMWSDLATNTNVTSALGLLFFYIFYRTVVLNYQKQKKDYADRLKIQKYEADEKRRIRQLENELADLDDEEEGKEGGDGEENAYLKMANQFMKSGARVRRAGGRRRISEFLERDVDVKFTDVAGLGKIRLELEEIVKFFTHGEMYRRRGVKIPGPILSSNYLHLSCP